MIDWIDRFLEIKDPYNWKDSKGGKERKQAQNGLKKGKMHSEGIVEGKESTEEEVLNFYCCPKKAVMQEEQNNNRIEE